MPLNARLYNFLMTKNLNRKSLTAGSPSCGSNVNRKLQTRPQGRGHVTFCSLPFSMKNLMLKVSNISREKPAHTPDTPHVHPLSCELEWTNQKHFDCFLLKPIKDNLVPGFLRALPPGPSSAEELWVENGQTRDTSHRGMKLSLN